MAEVELNKKLISFANLRQFKEKSDECYLPVKDRATTKDILDLFNEVLQPGTNEATVTLSNYILELQQGQSVLLEATISPEDTANKDLFWASTDETIVTITDDGYIHTGSKDGTAVVVVMCAASGNYATCTVVVKTAGNSEGGSDEPPVVATASFTPPTAFLNGTTLSWTSNTFATNGYTVRIVNNLVNEFTVNSASLDLTSVTARANLATGRNIIAVKVNATSDRLASQWSDPPVIYTMDDVEVPPVGTGALDSIYLSSSPTKVTYYKNQRVDWSGIEVTALYDDFTKEIIPISDMTVAGFDTSTSGTKTITLTYNGKSTSFTITVLSSEVPDFEDEADISLPGFYNNDNVLLARWDEPNKIVVYSEDDSAATEIAVDVSVDYGSISTSGYLSSTTKTKPKSLYNAVLALESHLEELNETVTKVLLPETITVLGALAFYGLETLDKVMLPSSISAIGVGCFAGNNLTSIAVANSCKHFYSKDNCVINSQDNAVVAGCKNSKFANITAAKIADWALYSCVGGPKHIDLSATIEEVGAGAFYKCSSIVDVNTHNGLVTVGKYAFCECTKLSSIRLSDTVVSIGSKAFYTYSSSSSFTPLDVYVGNGLQTIDYSAFYFPNYKSATASTDLRIHTDDFAAWLSVERQVGWLYRNGWNGNGSDVWYTTGQSNGGYMLYVNDVLITSIEIPASILSLKPYALSYIANNITDIILPDSLITVEHNALSFCGCGNIAAQSSSPETSLHPTLTIGKNVVFEDNNIGCFTAHDINLSSENIKYKYSYTNVGWLTTVDNTAVIAVTDQFYRTTPTTLSIPEGVVSIGDGVFAHKYKTEPTITTITIPSSLRIVGAQAFYNNRLITQLTIPSTIETIGTYALHILSNLRSLTWLSDATYSMEDSRFGGGIVLTIGCKNLNTSFSKDILNKSSVTIESNVQYIKGYAFETNYTQYLPASFVFKEKSGWKCGSTTINAEDLADNSALATYSQYRYYAWQRTA